jgi:MFS transporter, FSR family, fosmidomycin resistance protein
VATNPLILLGLLSAAHFLVDVVAGTTNPIWPALEQHLSLDRGGLLWVYVCWSLATSVSQLLFGLWADRRPSRWLIWAGPLVAILCISCVGLATSPWSLALLFVVGGLGVAAFHPEAAATSGALLPAQRSRAMAIFALCGYLGQSVGPYYSGAVTDALGLKGLTWGIVWGLPLLLLLCLGLRNSPAAACSIQPQRAVKSPGALPLGIFSLLLAVGALRIMPALGVPLALAYLLEATSASNAVIGAVQSAFMAGIGVGSMACAALLQDRWERPALWVFPLLAAPLLAILGLVTGWTLVALVGTCGVLLGVTMPVYISYGQQLLPHGQRVASSITMGVSWGIGGGGVALAMSVLTALDSLGSIFLFFAAAAVASSLLCHWLPYSDRSTHS